MLLARTLAEGGEEEGKEGKKEGGGECVLDWTGKWLVWAFVCDRMGWDGIGVWFWRVVK